MKKTLKNILLAATFATSFGIGEGYSQVKTEYYTGNPNGPKSEIKRIDEKTYNELRKTGEWWVLSGIWEDNYSTHKQYIAPKSTLKNYVASGDKPPATQNKPNTNNNQRIDYDKSGNVRNLNKEVVDLHNVNRGYTPTKNKNSDLEDLGKTIVTGAAIVGGLYLLNELFKPRQKNTYIEPPKNNPPVNKPLINKSSSGPWWEDNAKEENKNWWDDSQKENAQKKAEKNKNFWDDKPSKELSDLVKEQNKYSPETKKKLEEEAKKADEYFKERGMNPGAQVKYKVLGTAEIGPNGELIKKDSYSPEREMTDEEKVVLYYSYQAMKKDPLTGSVMEGVEIMNNPEKVDEFFKERGMNPGAQVKYKVVGTAEISPNGELIKKDSYSPERELTDAEKVILYYSYNLSKNYTQAGPVIKGVETINKLEKDVDFLFVKSIGDNNYSYFKLAGKEDYVVMKDGPSGNAIIDVADFKEKSEKSTNFWDE